MTFQLFESPTSPFVRKVNVVIAELGLSDQVERVAAAGTPMAPGTMPVAHNPLGKIPTLARPEGPALFDSRVICRYLDAHAGGALYPATRLWEVLTLEAMADGMLDAAVSMIYEARCRPEEKRFPDWVEAQWAKVARGLDAAEATWLPHLAGKVDAGQIALGCALGYLDFRFADRDWRHGRPGLAAWFAEFGQRPAMLETAPVG